MTQPKYQKVWLREMFITPCDALGDRKILPQLTSQGHTASCWPQTTVTFYALKEWSHEVW